MIRPMTGGFAGEFDGDFETHVTVGCDDAGLDDAGLAALETWAAERNGMKLTHILLSRGRVRSQPMLTFNGTGTLSAQRETAAATVRVLSAHGFHPTRVKIEASPRNASVPQNTENALRLGPEFYFEHHVKLALGSDTDLETLASLVIPHGAHLSWNARRKSAPGVDERFVTQRCHGVGLPEASSQLDSLRDELRGHGYQILSTVQEFVVFDSDASLDAGWIEQARPTASSTSPLPLSPPPLSS
jgi:hypothetical protein